MVNVLPFSCQQCICRFIVLLVKGFSETGLLDIYLTTFFGVCNFKNSSVMRVILFLKIFKIESKIRKSKTKQKNSENIFRLL